MVAQLCTHGVVPRSQSWQKEVKEFAEGRIAAQCADSILAPLRVQ
jgi:hypothetical protein